MKVLVDYSILKELCDSIKKDKSTFTGRIKSEVRKNATSKKKEVDETKRLLLSKRKNKPEKPGKEKTRKRESFGSSSELSGKSGSGQSSDESGSESESSGSELSINSDGS